MEYLDERPYDHARRRIAEDRRLAPHAAALLAAADWSDDAHWTWVARAPVAALLASIGVAPPLPWYRRLGRWLQRITGR